VALGLKVASVVPLLPMPVAGGASGSLGSVALPSFGSFTTSGSVVRAATSEPAGTSAMNRPYKLEVPLAHAELYLYRNAMGQKRNIKVSETVPFLFQVVVSRFDLGC
jgi:hypothetical protein